MKKKMYIIPASQTAEITTLYRLCNTSAGVNNNQDVDKKDKWAKEVW